MGRVSTLSLLLIAPPASAQGERRLPLVDAALSSDLKPQEHAKSPTTRESKESEDGALASLGF